MIHRTAGEGEAAGARRLTEELFPFPDVQDGFPPVPDRRITARQRCKPVLVLVSDSSSLSTLWVGRAFNWTPAGIALALIGPPVFTGDELVITWGQGSVLRLSVPARVVHCDQEGPCWNVGCQFLNRLHPEILELITEEQSETLALETTS
jgi:hypothetical protein